MRPLGVAAGPASMPGRGRIDQGRSANSSIGNLLTPVAAWSSAMTSCPRLREARLVAGERDGSMVVAAASKATAANAEMIIPQETGVSARLAARFNRAKRAFEAVIFSGGEPTCPSQRPLRRWIGVDPGELYFRCGAD